jgi:hypothetical protein
MEKPRLCVIRGLREGMQVTLDVSPFTLGRKTDNTLVLPDPTISSYQARIVEHIGLYWLEDLGSTNGTYFLPPRGKEFRLTKDKPVLLVEGACIRLGGADHLAGGRCSCLPGGCYFQVVATAAGIHRWLLRRVDGAGAGAAASGAG